MTLASGHRADLLALGPKGELVIIEVKSSLADFQSDQKWPAYQEHCDRFSFAVAPDFPLQVLPDEVGVLIADAYGADVHRAAETFKLPPARRKDVTARFARTAALRLTAIHDPQALLDAPPRL